MKKHILLFLLFATTAFLSISFTQSGNSDTYKSSYLTKLQQFSSLQDQLLKEIETGDLQTEQGKEKIRQRIATTRNDLKGLDFWFRYLEPIAYKKLNGPLPVEWETEVFEKFEKPYKREGTGLTLAEGYLDEEKPEREVLASLIKSSIEASKVYYADSITEELKSYHHFFLCNRLFILNLASIYTTGFECPDSSRVIPELRSMLANVQHTYQAFNESFGETPLSAAYLEQFRKTIEYVNQQPLVYSHFDHFTFIKDYVNPLFKMNQRFIKSYHVVSRSYVDYSLNKNATSIFDKALYHGQNSKGIFLRVKDQEVLSEIDKVGKLLFYDPILSGNNQRSCVSCHRPTEYFTDTLATTSLQFNHQGTLPRNSPTLINVGFNHLIMMDGRNTSLQDQTKAVILNAMELGSNEKEVVEKIMSCKEYNTAFKKFLKHTPQEKEVTLDHIASAITLYYEKFSRYYSPFDEAMNESRPLEASAKKGFNVFMSKAQCATCHFIPQFNGVKPPFVNSEFEVIGVPNNKDYAMLSSDKGRFDVNPADETLNAFRTGSLRNIAYTKPYMHNGAFSSLKEVVDFYDTGGGAGRGLKVANQTLSSDSLHLSTTEKDNLIQFMISLNERIVFETAPAQLPISRNKELNSRKIGGSY